MVLKMPLGHEIIRTSHICNELPVGVPSSFEDK